MNRQLNRLTPRARPEIYDTYAIAAPHETHWRTVSCTDAGCLAQRNGWTTKIDESSQLGARQGAYIRRVSGRRFTVERGPDGITQFTFQPGQQCFAAHRVRNDRPDLCLVRPGDWRTPVRRQDIQVMQPRDWVDKFQTNQDQLARIRARG